MTRLLAQQYPTIWATKTQYTQLNWMDKQAQKADLWLNFRFLNREGSEELYNVCEKKLHRK